MKSITFYDDWLVERRDGLERIWCQPRFVRGLFGRGHPATWGYHAPCAFFDERTGTYAMYLSVGFKTDADIFTVRLDSGNPIEWPEPEFDESADPIWDGYPGLVREQNGTPFWTAFVCPTAGTSVQDRGAYLTTTFYPGLKESAGVYGFSEDGGRFDLAYENPWTSATPDCWHGAVWDEQEQRFLILTRPAWGDRRVALVTTKDFRAFTKPTLLLHPDAEDGLWTEYYGMAVFPVDDGFVGLLQVFHTQPATPGRGNGDGRVEIQLLHSRNGTQWNRTTRSPFIAGGVRDGGMDPHCVYVQSRVVLEDRELFYASSSKHGHGVWPPPEGDGAEEGRCLVYEMRREGYCALRTWAKEGFLRTRSLRPQAADMGLNVRTHGGVGSVLVQVVNGETAEPFPGFTFEEAVPICGDHMAAAPRWKDHADITPLLGKHIRIEMRLVEAELYAIRLNCNAFLGMEISPD